MLRGYYEWAQWDILLDLKNGGSYETHQAVRDQVEWSVKPYVFLNTKAPE
jgi:hypothetical protein